MVYFQLFALCLVYLLQNGVSLPQIALLQGAYSLIVLLFEFPTAVFADSYSRKLSVILGVVCSSMLYIFYLYPEYFYLLLIGQILYSLGLVLISGAFEGWVINEIEVTKNTYKDYAHLWTEIQGIGSIITGGIALYLLYLGFGYNVLLIGSFFIINMCALVFVFCREKPNMNTITFKFLFDNAKKSFLMLRNHGKMYIFIFLAFTLGMQIIYHFWQPLFSNLEKNIASNLSGKQLITLFIVYTVTFLSQFISNNIYRKYIPEKYYFTSGSVLAFNASLCILVCIIIVDINIFVAIIFYGFMQGSTSLIPIIIRSYYIKRFAPENISAIFAFLNMISRFGAVILLGLISLQNEILDVKYLFIISVTMFFIIGISLIIERIAKAKTTTIN